MNQLERWQGRFGDDYSKRNDYDPKLRLEAFKALIPNGVRSVLEVGCNIGNNLETISALGIPTVVGIEPNVKAARIGKERGRTIIIGEALNLPIEGSTYDLVFTAGVLMHIPDYRDAMREIWRVTRKYALAIEYMGDGESITYHGNDDMLWRRKGYVYPGELIGAGKLGEEFDHCGYQLYKKQ